MDISLSKIVADWIDSTKFRVDCIKTDYYNKTASSWVWCGGKLIGIIDDTQARFLKYTDKPTVSYKNSIVVLQASDPQFFEKLKEILDQYCNG